MSDLHELDLSGSDEVWLREQFDALSTAPATATATRRMSAHDVRRRGTARRRLRTGSLAAATALAVVAALPVTRSALPGGDAASTVGAPPAGPAAADDALVRTLPQAERIDYGATAPAGSPASIGGRTRPVPGGPVTVEATDQDGVRLVMYVSTDDELCVAWVSAGRALQAGRCDAIAGYPLRGDGLYTILETVPRPDRPVLGQSVIVAGVVKGPVSRVVLRTSHGDVEARLTPAPSWLHGPLAGSTLYWADTGEPARDLAQRLTASVRRIVYRGDRAVFSCAEAECID